jgi:hypothetical protein
MIHRSAYLYIFLYRYGGACIRSAAPIRFGLAPHFSLAKTPRIPRIEYQAYLHTYTTYLSLKILSVESFRCHFLDSFRRYREPDRYSNVNIKYLRIYGR